MSRDLKLSFATAANSESFFFALPRTESSGEVGSNRYRTINRALAGISEWIVKRPHKQISPDPALHDTTLMYDYMCLLDRPLSSIRNP